MITYKTRTNTAVRPFALVAGTALLTGTLLGCGRVDEHPNVKDAAAETVSIETGIKYVKKTITVKENDQIIQVELHSRIGGEPVTRSYSWKVVKLDKDGIEIASSLKIEMGSSTNGNAAVEITKVNFGETKVVGEFALTITIRVEKGNTDDEAVLEVTYPKISEAVKQHSH